MNKPLDRDAIAAAMRDAAWKAINGTVEERSGIFNPTPIVPQTKPKPRAARG